MLEETFVEKCAMPRLVLHLFQKGPTISFLASYRGAILSVAIIDIKTTENNYIQGKSLFYSAAQTNCCVYVCENKLGFTIMLLLLYLA